MSATLTPTEILLDTLEAIKVQFPMLKRFSTDFKSMTAVKDQQVYAHIQQVPSVQNYDGSTGFKANATNAKDLMVDIPIKMDQLRHVPVKIAYLDAISTAVDKYKAAIANVAYALGKDIVDYALSKAVLANFSTQVVQAASGFNRDTLSTITGTMNKNGAAPNGRFGIVNSDVFNALDSDQRIASSLFHGERRAGDAYGVLRDVAGFMEIHEYPSLPVNSIALNGFFGDPRAICIASRVPDMSQAVAGEFGIPQIASFQVETDPDTGLSMLGILWQEPGTFDLYMTMALLYGAVAGSQGGSVGAKADYAGALSTES